MADNIDQIAAGSGRSAASASEPLQKLTAEGLPGDASTGVSPEALGASRGSLRAVGSPASAEDVYLEPPPPGAPGPGSIEGSGWRRFVGVPVPLRSWLTRAMIHVEGVLGYLMSLDEKKLTPDVQAALGRIGKSLELIANDFQSPFLDNGNLSLLGLERIQNLLFQVDRGWILRININMTLANKLDPSGKLGTAFKYAVTEWLQKDHGMRHVSRNPEGTSFLVIDVKPHQMSCSLGRFAREVGIILGKEEVRERFGFDPALLENFLPQATSMVAMLSAEGLDPKKIVEEGNHGEILALQEKIIERIEGSLRLLAVGTSLAEKDPASIGFEGGLAVYNAADLPLSPEKAGHDVLQKFLELGVGYVPASVYWSPAAGGYVSPPKTALHPRYGHDYGRLDHPKRPDSPGGAFQVMLDAFEAAKAASSPGEKRAAVAAVHGAAKQFGIALILGEIARAHPRNPAFTKYSQEVVLHDGKRFDDFYFLEEMALVPEGKINLVVTELDSFWAFSRAHGIDEMDSKFWGVYDHFFSVAHEMGMRPPVISQVAGDLVAVALPVADIKGKPVDVSEYMRRVKESVAKSYGNLEFQVYVKVKIPNGTGVNVVRMPLWVKDGKQVFSKGQPEGAEPFMSTLSFTSVATVIDTPRDAEAASKLSRVIFGSAELIEEMKEKDPRKDGFLIVPSDALQQLADQHVSSPHGIRASGVAIVGAKPENKQKPESGRAPPWKSPKAPSKAGARIGGVYYPTGSSDFRAFSSAVNQQLNLSWGEGWTSMSADVQERVIGELYSMASDSPPVVGSAVIQNAFSAVGFVESTQAIPPFIIIYLPLTAGVH